MRNLKYLLVDDSSNKSIVHQLGLIGTFLQSNVENRVFVHSENIYVEYLPEYANYFGRLLRLKKSIYGMTNSGKLFADELTNWMIDESIFKKSQFQMSIYYKYAPDRFKLVVLSYVDDCLYWHTYEEPGT